MTDSFHGISITMVKCDNCTCAVDIYFMGMCSDLGPRDVVCHKCQKTVATARTEWPEMAGLDKCRFVAVSALYAVVIFFFGAYSTTIAADNLAIGHALKGWRFEDRIFQAGGIAWSVSVVLIQNYRVFRSLWRIGDREPIPLQGSMWSFQVGGQWKMLGILIIIPVTCWLLHHVAALFG